MGFWNFWKKKPKGHEFTDAERRAAVEARTAKKELEELKYQIEIEKLREKKRDITQERGDLVGQKIDDALEIAERLGWVSPDDLEENGEEDDANQLAAFLQALQGKGNLQGNAPGNTPPSPDNPQPPQDKSSPEMIAKMPPEEEIKLVMDTIPEKIQALVREGIYTEQEFFLLCGAVWKRLNTAKT